MADALDILRGYLRPYGLDSDDAVNAAWSFAQANPSLASNESVLLNATRNTDTYKKRFAGNAERTKRGLPELTPATYLQYEEGYRATLRGLGMPIGFYDTEADFAKFIANDVEPKELALRVEKGYKAVANADPTVVAELKRLYAVDDASIAAFFIDPTRAQDLVIKQSQAAQAAAEARRQAGMELSATQAEALATEFGDQTKSTAQAGFAAIGEQQQLFQAQMQGEQAISQAEQIGATFGTNAEARRAIAARKRRRATEFEAGGGFAGETSKGVSGLTTVGE
jgi:hypothetical protein